MFNIISGWKYIVRCYCRVEKMIAITQWKGLRMLIDNAELQITLTLVCEWISSMVLLYKPSPINSIDLQVELFLWYNQSPCDFTMLMSLLFSLPCQLVCEHLHTNMVNGGVYNDPCPTPQFTIGRDIDQNWLIILSECINNVSAKLQYLVIHVWNIDQVL